MNRELGLFVCLVCLVAGCSSFQDPLFNAPDGLGSDPVLVIPFREPKAYHWYGESERGVIAAEAFQTWARKNANPTFLEDAEVDVLMRKVRDFTADEIRLEEWIDMSSDLEVRYILVGQIEEIALASPTSVGFHDASLRASYKVIDAKQRKTVWQRKSFTVNIGEGRATDIPLVALNVDTRDLERRLLAKLGEQIGRDLYGYDDHLSYN